MRIILIVIVAVLIALAVYSSILFVDASEFVYVTQFGRPIVTYDGRTEAGWHWKLPWPVQSVQRLGRQLQVFDLPATELLTHEKVADEKEGKENTVATTLAVEAFVCWRIPDKASVGQFIVTVGTPEQARDVLRQEVNSRLGAEISKRQMGSLVSVADTDTVRGRMDELSKALLESLQGRARSEYGIDIVDIRLRRFNYAASVRDSIFQRIITERELRAARHRREGYEKSENIKSKAAREAQDILTEAKAAEIRTKREADVKADQLLNEAHAKDREFYTFLQKLEAYKKMLGETKDVLLLSSKHEIFDMLLKPPKPGEPLPPPATLQPPAKEPPM